METSPDSALDEFFGKRPPRYFLDLFELCPLVEGSSGEQFVAMGSSGSFVYPV